MTIRGGAFRLLFNVKVTRVADAAVLRAKMATVEDPAAAVGKVAGAGGVYVVANTGQSGLLGLVYGLKGAGQVQVVEKEFAGAGGTKVPAGSLVVTGVADEAMAGALKLAGLDAVRMDATPSGLAMHAVKAAAGGDDAYVAIDADGGVVAVRV